MPVLPMIQTIMNGALTILCSLTRRSPLIQQVITAASTSESPSYSHFMLSHHIDDKFTHNLDNTIKKPLLLIDADATQRQHPPINDARWIPQGFFDNSRDSHLTQMLVQHITQARIPRST
ncbi:hypothetical protein BD769DRAFT_1393754 [Suillus cothurnatus]|nr:hypothetical protein BD769DRAFT_1393754 [Suillus cothurnatus]